MGGDIVKKRLLTPIKLDHCCLGDENLTAVIKDLEFELGKAASKVFRGECNILVAINYIEVDGGHVMVSASFHGE